MSDEQLSAISYQRSAISCQLSAVSPAAAADRLITQRATAEAVTDEPSAISYQLSAIGFRLSANVQLQPDQLTAEG
jgi:hypothetical protein